MDKLCIPPPEHRRHRWHWLRCNDGDPWPARWLDNMRWYMGGPGSLGCKSSHDIGWRYLRPALAPGKQDDAQQVAWLETKLAEADTALAEIRKITGLTHTGVPRAHAAVSRIDQIARKALA